MARSQRKNNRRLHKSNGEELSMKIVIPVEPKTKKNSSRIIVAGGKKMLIPSKQYLEFEKSCEPFLQPLKIDYAINLKCIF